MRGGKPFVNASRLAAGRLVAVLVAALVVSGCGVLFPPTYPMPGDESMKPIAFYKQGSATLTLGDGTKLVLDKVGADSSLYDMMGANVHWTGASGWHLRLTGAANSGFGSFAYLQLDRIADGQHLTIWDSSRCIIDVAKADDKAVRGTATCKGLQWSDALSTSFEDPLSSAPVAGQPKFDAEITFEAFPGGATA
ncbi:MAG TPA: hypothetical protein VH813_11130 [Candidatus Limnocylindrales bacterium]|jgi:hypothetical protein